jgi:hypothetical protein
MARNLKKPRTQGKNESKGHEQLGVESRASIRPIAPQALPHEPGISRGSVDVTGIVPEDVHVDPDITEGHPGYEESGSSEMHPSR